ncbi:type II toxin-antitoxin system death-on-curing family toxin [Piscibacillus sp. B03]|uniref:type II toxin-antitoxin system death-on-curing family toxin n=1 Tax=Piscibacillus sp. B03 TaxID=3457430 RepID=UPI003FCC97AA
MVMKRYGEGEQAGIKDDGLLESAIYRPQQTLFEEDAYLTLFEKASVLFESLARNHCFHNGNKRTALASLDVFLKKNGYRIIRNDTVNEEITVQMAAGELTISDMTEWLKNNTKPYS